MANSTSSVVSNVSSDSSDVIAQVPNTTNISTDNSTQRGTEADVVNGANRAITTGRENNNGGAGNDCANNGTPRNSSSQIGSTATSDGTTTLENPSGAIGLCKSPITNTNSNTLNPTTISSATGGKVGNISPQTESAAKSFAASNSGASIGDLANELKVDLQTAQQLNNSLKLGLTNTSSNKNTATNGNNKLQGENTSNITAGNSNDSYTSTSTSNTLVEGNNGAVLPQFLPGTFGDSVLLDNQCAKVTFKASSQGTTKQDFAASIYAGRNGAAVSIGGVERGTGQTLPSDGSGDAAMLFVMRAPRCQQETIIIKKNDGNGNSGETPKQIRWKSSLPESATQQTAMIQEQPVAPIAPQPKFTLVDAVMAVMFG